MPQTIAPNRSQTVACAQAARILRVTAQQWGMCEEVRQPMPQLSALRKVRLAPCVNQQALLHSGVKLAA